MARNNSFEIIGHLTKNATPFPNSDGSCTVKFTVAVPRTFTRADGTRDTDYIECQKFLGKKTPKGIVERFKKLEKGDAVTVYGMIKANNYTKKDGTKVYGFICEVEDFDHNESKAAKAARLARKAAAAA